MKTYKTKDYSRFSFITFNRNTKPHHVKEIGKSIDEYGFLGVLIVIRTAAITGVEQDFIIDGQHRFLALKERDLPIEYKFVQLDTLREIARFMAKINNTSSNWGLKDYLEAFAGIGLNDYRLVQEKYEKTGIALSLLVDFYRLSTTNHRTSFKEGKFTISNFEQSLSLIETFKACLPYVPNDYHKFLKDFGWWTINKRPDRDRIVSIVKNNNIPSEEIVETLDRLYNQES